MDFSRFYVLNLGISGWYLEISAIFIQVCGCVGAKLWAGCLIVCTLKYQRRGFDDYNQSALYKNLSLWLHRSRLGGTSNGLPIFKVSNSQLFLFSCLGIETAAPHEDYFRCAAFSGLVHAYTCICIVDQYPRTYTLTRKNKVKWADILLNRSGTK